MAYRHTNALVETLLLVVVRKARSNKQLGGKTIVLKAKKKLFPTFAYIL